MSSSVVFSQGSKQVAVAANESIAVYSKSPCQVYRSIGFPQFPSQDSLLGTVSNGQTVFGPFASGATIIINPGASNAMYEVGVAPVVLEVTSLWNANAAPNALNATGALTAAMMFGKIITSTTAAAVAGTVPTGAVLDAAADLEIGDTFEWSVIATGANAFTVTAASGHTLVGVAVVATVTSGRFLTRKTAAATFVTYRVS